MPIRAPRRRRKALPVPVPDGWAHLPENERARLARLAAGLSQREMADITGRTLREVRAIEAGRADAASMKAYRQAFGYHVAGVAYDWVTARVDPAPGMLVEVRMPPRVRLKR